MTTLNNIIICVKIPDEELKRIERTYENVHYLPDVTQPIPAEVLAKADTLFTHAAHAIPTSIRSKADVPNLRFIQNSATGVERICRSPLIQSYSSEELQSIAFCNAAGGYSVNMGTFIMNYITGLYNSIPSMIYLQRTTKKWAEPEDVMADAGREGIYGSKTIYGKTFGFLGYGSLGREFARMCSIFPKSRLIAATSSGERKKDDTFVLPGTGDTDGKLPEKFYSTSNPSSLRDFISECDVLISSLPSTKATVGLLSAEKLGWMKPGGLFINVGRGSIIPSEDILKALDAPNGLLGAAIDVTEPEPLPANHPLWSHPRLMITPHLSGESEGELSQSTNILLANTEKLRNGQAPFNSVSFTAGY